MNFNQAVNYLHEQDKDADQKNEEQNISGMEELLRKLKMPHKRMGITIHVAGSNGKSSVCAMIANILKVSGYNVGLYTSPYLRRITERIRINNEEISKNKFATYIQRVRSHVSNQTFFEIMTAIAFSYFADMHVDFSIIESGHSSMLDVTNVVDSTISVITNVHLEHTSRLENTEVITRDMTSIIKQGTICVTAAEGDALRIIEEACKEKMATLFISKATDFSRLGLKGEVQKINAGTAIKVIKVLKKLNLTIIKIHIIEGLQTVQLSGRMEFVEPRLLVDVAHNYAGMTQLVLELEMFKREKQFSKIVCIVGILADVNWKLMLDELVRVVDIMILTKPLSDYAAEPVKLERYLVKQFAIEPVIIENVKMALSMARKDAEKDALIVVTGSFYTVAEIFNDTNH